MLAADTLPIAALVEANGAMQHGVDVDTADAPRHLEQDLPQSTGQLDDCVDAVAQQPRPLLPV